jgi:hypothetical protein
MPARATDGTCLVQLVMMAIEVCRAAQRLCHHRGPGRSPTYDDVQIAVLILIAVLNRRKSKSAQYRFLNERRAWLMWLLDMEQFPVRSTYFSRYREAHRIFEAGVRVQGRLALADGITDATTVAVDKSLVAARGPVNHPKPRSYEKPKPGVDCQAGWAYSEHDGWVYGYGFETVVTATTDSLVFPLLASVDAANRSEHRTFKDKIALLPEVARYVLADKGYDSNANQQAVESDPQGNPTGRRFLCPLILRAGKARVGQYPHRGQRGRLRQRRQLRQDLMNSPAGRRIYQRRTKSVEPFHEWFKNDFELGERVWHRGLDNNRTQILAAMVCYQLMVRYNHRLGYRNGKIQWIFDRL